MSGEDPPSGVETLAADLRCLRADNPGPLTLDGTRTWILGSERPVVVDPGPEGPGRTERVTEAVRAAAAGPAEAVCLTHAHADHAGCAAEVAARLSAPLLASAEALRRLGEAGPDRRETGGPAAARALADGERVPVDGGRSHLEVVEAPGHSRDHLAFLWLPSRALLTGDLVLGRGSSLIVFPDGDVGAALASLARLIALRPSRLLPGHGPPVEDAVGRLAEYRRHRLERDRQVRDALEAGAGSMDQLRTRVYGDIEPDLRRPAELSLLAHLAHLRREGTELPAPLESVLRSGTAEGPPP